MLSEIFLSDPDNLHLDAVSLEDDILVLEVRSVHTSAPCPDCQELSSREHSHYWRHPADLACMGRQVRLQVFVRRFFCDNIACSRRTFAERFTPFLAPFARRTVRLSESQRGLGVITGGEVGAAVLSDLGMPASGDTMLRLIRAVPPVTTSTPRVIGIDDWAWCKGQRYGTLIVDLEKHRPIELLPDRTADSVVAWLQAHPSVEIVSRDRGSEYIDGVTRGAPQAIQVADRWHLLQNLKNALERVLERHRQCLYAAADAPEVPVVVPVAPEKAADQSESDPQLTASQQRQQRTRQKRLERYQAVHKLHQQGWSQRKIARELRLGRGTVQRYLRAESFPEMAQRRTATSILDPYREYLQKRWTEGCHNGAQLYREIQQRGYLGSYARLRQWTASQRKMLRTTETATETETPAPPPVVKRPWSTRCAVWLLLKPSADLSTAQAAALERMLQVSAPVRQVYAFAQAFQRIVRQRLSRALEPWLTAVKTYQVLELAKLARSFEKDKAAIHAALTQPWSNGQTEGQVNRLKLIKRQMYGRAKFDLLRARVLA